MTVSFDQGARFSEQLSPGRYQFASRQSEQFQLTIQGQLDDDEQAALAGLFEQVQSLSERFFAGDLGTALEEALSLGYDANELAAFSLDLRQQSFAQQVQQYQTAPVELPTPELERLKAPLASYVDSYISALEQANPLADAVQVLDDIVSQLVDRQEPLRPTLLSFNEGIRSQLSSLIR